MIAVPDDPKPAPAAPLTLVPTVVAKGPSPATQWKPGQSGNPLGKRRRDNDEMVIAFRTHTDAARVTLATIMLDSKRKASDRIAAAREILNRGWGAAPDLVDFDASDESNALPFDIRKLSDDELFKLRELVAKARGNMGGGG